MALKQRKQITGTTEQINQYAGVEGQLVWDKSAKTLVGMSGTAGKNYPLAPKAYVDNEVSKVNSEATKKADKTYVDQQLAKKQPIGDYATNAQLTQGLAGKAPSAHTHTVSQITDMPKVVLSVNDITPDDSGNVKVGALPLGHLFAWPFQTPPDGAIQCNGATYNRALYKDFFAYATSKGWVKTESEWQSIASANGGYCPYYSQGDGSTTFRTPKFAPFMQVAIASANVGKYRQAGLPEIEGTISAQSSEESNTENTGAFYTIKRGHIDGSSSVESHYAIKVGFKASGSNAIYGRSTTVQPESHEWMICVVVAGQATNLGSVDVSNVMSAVAQVQAQVGEIQKPKAYITETWHSGTSWYRKWSDGWIEQGGYNEGGSDYGDNTVTLPTSFAGTNYWVSVQNWNGDWVYSSAVISKTNSSYFVRTRFGKNFHWHACGY